MKLVQLIFDEWIYPSTYQLHTVLARMPRKLYLFSVHDLIERLHIFIPMSDMILFSLKSINSNISSLNSNILSLNFDLFFNEIDHFQTNNWICRE